jgi:hypothetical protein
MTELEASETGSDICLDVDGSVDSNVNFVQAAFRSADVSRPMVHGVQVAVLVGIVIEKNIPLVIFPGQIGSAAVKARSTIHVDERHIGKEVVLLFENGDPWRPLIVGMLQYQVNLPDAMAPLEVTADGERVLVAAKEQLVLRCGKASITLTKTGKVLIKGCYISSRSSGVNRITGGSVQLN